MKLATPETLNDDERDLLIGLLATFSIDMHRMLRNPTLTKDGLREYQESIHLADSARFKLLGR
jgi:hypothetical protein